MVISSTEKILKNVEDKFYYCGIEISKQNFNIQEFSYVCNKINEIKNSFSSENAKKLSRIREITPVAGNAPITKEIDLIAVVNKNTVFLGLYNRYDKRIEPLTKKLLKYIDTGLINTISFQLSKAANKYEKGIIETGYDLSEPSMLFAVENYRNNIEKLSICFYHTYEIEFINGYKDYIMSDEELKNSLTEI